MRKSRLIPLVLAIAMIITCTIMPANTAKAAGTPTITVETVDVETGSSDTVDVNVSIANNPGICTLWLAINYDSALELVDVVDKGSLIGSDFETGGDIKANPFIVSWDDSANKNGDSSFNGTFMTLKFKVKSGASLGKHKVWLTFPYPGNSAYNTEDTVSDSSFSLKEGGIDLYVPVITGQPQNTTVNTGEIASFSVKTSGSGLTYMWQYKEKGKDTWVDWTNKKTADITVAYADYRNGMSFRCVVTDSTGRKHISDAAVLTYTSAPSIKITQQPQDATVAPDTLASFSVNATGSGLTYLWQYKNKGESTWTDWTSKKTADITVAYSASRNGMSLRCKITDKSGNTVTSSAAVLTYSSASSITITAQPQNATVAPNTLASFSVKATGSGLTYLWQYKNKGESSWTDWTSKKTAD
nr:hypothetical protein [Lachnospiraceae bacterium]